MSTIHRYEPVLDVVDGEDAVCLTQEIVRIPSVVGDEEQLSAMPWPGGWAAWATTRSRGRRRCPAAPT